MSLNYLLPVLRKREARDRWIEKYHPEYDSLDTDGKRAILRAAFEATK